MNIVRKEKPDASKKLTKQQKILNDPNTKTITCDQYFKLLDESDKFEKLFLSEEKKQVIIGVNDEYFSVKLPDDFDHTEYFFQDEHFEKNQKMNLPILTELLMYGCHALSDELINGLQRLQKLTVVSCDGITHSCVQNHKQMTHLTTANCAKLNQNVVGYLQNLKSLSFSEDSHDD